MSTVIKYYLLPSVQIFETEYWYEELLDGRRILKMTLRFEQNFKVGTWEPHKK